MYNSLTLPKSSHDCQIRRVKTHPPSENKFQLVARIKEGACVVVSTRPTWNLKSAMLHNRGSRNAIWAKCKPKRSKKDMKNPNKCPWVGE